MCVCVCVCERERERESPTRCTLFLINLFQLNFPINVSNKYIFIIRSLFLYTQYITTHLLSV